jgi:hypothetical protein
MPLPWPGSQAGRILGDAIAMAGKSDALLRQALAKAGVAVPANFNLDLAKYLNNRGVKPLNFQPEAEFKDPFGIQDKLIPREALGIPSGPGLPPARPAAKAKTEGAKETAPAKPEEKK